MAIEDGWSSRGSKSWIFIIGENAIERMSSIVNVLPADPPTDGDTFEHIGLAAEYGADVLRSRATLGPFAGLFIDYGHMDPTYGDTLQAVREHRHEHPLASPGEADLTAQVNFPAFAKASRWHNPERHSHDESSHCRRPHHAGRIPWAARYHRTGIAADGGESGEGRRDRNRRRPSHGAGRHGHAVQGDWHQIAATGEAAGICLRSE